MVDTQKAQTSWPSARAIELFEEFRDDPFGWHWTDLEKLLDEWGITDGLPGEDPGQYHSRIYRTDGGYTYYFTYQEWDECPAGAVRHYCYQLEAILRDRRKA